MPQAPVNHQTLCWVEYTRLACALEATARKPGNVHPAASFDDLSYHDFVRSAEVAAPILARSRALGVGAAILEAVRATQTAVGRNTNLGICLLLAPLAAVDPTSPLAEGIAGVLGRLTAEDAALVYEAIRLAKPGGMGRVDQQDVAKPPTRTLLEVMRLASARDRVAAQYGDNFRLVLDVGVPLLKTCVPRGGCPNAAGHRPCPHLTRPLGTAFELWNEAIIGLQLHLMSRYPDTLILRKCGPDEARHSAVLAQAVLDAGWPHTVAGDGRLCEFDRWLRAHSHRRNPGTTADLITASLFAALRDEQIPAPTIDWQRCAI